MDVDAPEGPQNLRGLVVTVVPLPVPDLDQAALVRGDQKGVASVGPQGEAGHGVLLHPGHHRPLPHDDDAAPVEAPDVAPAPLRLPPQVHALLCYGLGNTRYNL